MIFGIDEAGRGPLAGPVCIGLVALDPENNIEGLKDSKKLSEKKRNELCIEIKSKSLYSDTVFIERDVIDEINIKQATIKGMEEVLSRIPSNFKPERILIDGNEKINTKFDYQSIVNGDQTEPSIMAAAILAKVTRDERMLEIDKEYPMYGFKNHKGYGGSKEHQKAIEIYGPCEHHRRSFAPIKNFDISAIEALKVHKLRQIVKKLLEELSDDEIKKEINGFKGKYEEEDFDLIMKILREEWLFIKKANQKRS